LATRENVVHDGVECVEGRLNGVPIELDLSLLWA
jgi:hypothetical protein